jgi:hypothetical protein
MLMPCAFSIAAQMVECQRIQHHHHNVLMLLVQSLIHFGHNLGGGINNKIQAHALGMKVTQHKNLDIQKSSSFLITAVDI